MSNRLFRIQDAEGRGPFRPGFSHLWLSPLVHRDIEKFPPIHVAFGLDWLDKVPHRWHCGTGCRSMYHLGLWFTDIELERLHNFGFTIVQIDYDIILAESDNQVLFARRKPLNKI